MLKRITGELKQHAPFTSLGAATGIIFIIVIALGDFLPKITPASEEIFYVLHPTHVFLSALTTTSIYMKSEGHRLWKAVMVGITGSLGIATLSDCIIPYIGETLLGFEQGINIGFIEKPLLTNSAAFLGIAIGCWKQVTKFPHFGHVLISTWASLFHVIMALSVGAIINWFDMIAIFMFLFLAVWIPCCTSDIAYPHIFTGNSKESQFHHH